MTEPISTVPLRDHVFGSFSGRVENGRVRLSFYYTTPIFDHLTATTGNGGDTGHVRISRRSEPGFTWGQDYQEYFNGMEADGATVVFDGELPAINRRKFEFVDEDVRPGGTYAYWVWSPLGRRPSGPVCVRVRDTRVWWPQTEIDARLTAIADAHPAKAVLQAFGETPGGHTIRGLRVGNRERCVALVGAVHAGESGPELMIPIVERLLDEQPALLARVGVAILPSVNIDERERLVHGCPWYLRTNARGVDINRNFAADWDRVDRLYGLVSSDPDAATYRGPAPESEPETQAVAAFLDAVRPCAVLSYHWLASMTGGAFLAPRAAEDDSEYLARSGKLADAYVAGMYPAERAPGAGWRLGSSTGSLPAYAYHALHVPGFDLEGDGSPECRAAQTDRTTFAMLGASRQRHCGGLAALLAVAAEDRPGDGQARA